MTTRVVVSRITLFSKDMDRTAEFYKIIGLDLEKSGSWSGRYHYLTIIRSAQDIIFEIHPLLEGATSPQGLGFDIENVPETLRKLVEFGSEVLRPHSRAYSRASIAAVRDPDGRTVTITQHGKAKPA